jgi:prepilin-type N-terminal cleavage/methylation domain-containing protein
VLKAGTVGSARRATAPAGFTLLEVLLASAIGVMLLGGLYVAVDVQLRQMHTGRRANEQTQLARNVLSKIAQDISGQLAPTLSTSITNSGSTSGASGTSSAATGAAATTASNVVQFNIGVLGDAQTLILSSSRVPKENLKAEILLNGDQVIGTSDLRRVMYWIAGGDAGLARYELKSATSTDQLAYFALPPGVPDETQYVIADEIKSIQFSYFDGTNWVDTWDGTQPSQATNSDLVTPQGPPIAIAIVIGVQTDDPEQQENKPSNSSLGGGNGLKMYRRVVAIPTANGATITPAATAQGQ